MTRPALLAAPSLSAVSVALTLAAVGCLAGGSPVWVVALLSVVSGGCLWVGRGEFDARTVLLVAIVLRAVALPLMPSLSDDVYRYVWDGRRVVEAGARPWAERPDDVAGFDPLLHARLNSPGYASVYPTVSQAVFAAGVWLGRGETRSSVVWIKALVTTAEVVGVALALRVVPAAWVAVYALHPVAVVEVAGMGHSEGLLVGVLGLLAWAFDRRHRATAGVAVALAAGVKLWPVALALPVVRRGGGRAVAGILVAGALLALPMADPSSLAGLRASLALYAGFFDWYAPLYTALKSGLWLALGEGAGRAAASVLGILWVALVAGLGATDDGSRRALVRSVGGIVGGYVVLSAVLHPWHLLPLLAVVPLLQFNWLVSAAPFTYLVYDGLSPWLPQAVGWGGALALGLWTRRRNLLDALMRRRARAKWRRIAQWMPPRLHRMLDLGGGEGFVADVAADATGAHVTLADVADYHRSPRPLVRLTGGPLPFSDGAFDATVLIYVLHHADDAESLLREAVRVTRGPVVVLESVVRVPWTRGAFERLDAAVHRVRSGARTPRPRWRSVAGWQEAAHRNGLALDLHDVRGIAHPTAVFIVRRAEP